ncbi:hypothetical protein niasHT_003649 [Heterodera trifolii]|uniref:Uncharacterized protein n=1 Tax=Heterodera trifolii TaxID=157864 RepID=A0ABD2MET6_9BILA
MENCRTELAPINVLWLSSMLLALASVPFCLSVLALLITAKCWPTDGDGAGGISLRAYLPRWDFPELRPWPGRVKKPGTRGGRRPVPALLHLQQTWHSAAGDDTARG